MIAFPDLSPEIFSIELFGMSFALRWYALAYIAGLLLGWGLIVKAVKTPRLWQPGQAPMSPPQVENLLTWVVIGVILGGRMGYVLFYQPAGFLADPLSVVKVWEGGMSFHGGFAGVVIAGLIFAARYQIPALSLGDLFAFAVTPGLLFGRLANFVNAELWGRPTDLPWGVAFPGEAAQACGDLVTLCARHPSQLYEAALEGVLLGALIFFLVLRAGWLRFPGRTMGLFITGYGAARFFVEFFRQPDMQFVSPGNPLGLAFHVNGYGITMGQALSLPMIFVGLWFMLRAREIAPASPAPAAAPTAAP